MATLEWFHIPPADEAVKRWHVSPAVDLAAYAFSWLPILVPLELLRQRYATDNVTYLLIVLGLTIAHRHYTLPYVYLDKEVFDRHPRRFTVFPLILFAGFLVTPWLWNTQARILVASVAFFAGAWTLWHIYMQKYGIFRMYAAKSGSSDNPPGRVDRLLVFSWMPLYLVWLGPTYREDIEWYYPTGKAYTGPILDVMTTLTPVLLVPASAVVVVSVAVFLRFEWRCYRLRNFPRLWMAIGTMALGASFLVFNPINVALAFAFSHAVEYMVFVWAYQRRRYHEPLPHDPLLGRVLRHSWWAYGLFTVATAGLYLCFRFWGFYIFPEAPRPTLLGVPAERWTFYWALYQSMMHFYYDGFLWKMRLPSVQKNL